MYPQKKLQADEPKRESPAQGMALAIFEGFSDTEQIEITKGLIYHLVDYRSRQYESFVNESRECESKAKSIAEGNQILSKLL